MNTVLVFTGRGGIDLSDFRWQLLRVPEVSLVLKEAQAYLEQMGVQDKDLVSFILGDANSYLSGGLWRELASKLMQIGLYRRYCKNSSRPQFVIGDSGVFSATAVCLEQQTLQEFVGTFVQELERRSQEEKSSEFLVGHRLETAKVYEYQQGEYVVTSEGKETAGLLENIRKDHLVDQVITVGSAGPLSVFNQGQDVGIVESVVIDPLLGWMLPYLRTSSTAVTVTPIQLPTTATTASAEAV